MTPPWWTAAAAGGASAKGRRCASAAPYHTSGPRRDPHKAAAQHLDEPFAPRLFDTLRLRTFSDDELHAAFDARDADGDGNLDRDEITLLIKDIYHVDHANVCATEAEKVADDTDRLLEKWDDDGDGLISRGEFEAHVKAHAEKLDKRVWAISGCMLATGVSVGIIIPVMPMLVQQMGLSTADFGLVVASFGASKLLGNIPSGVFVDRHGRLPLLSGGLAALGVATGAIGFAGDLPQLVACRFAMGLGVSAFITAATMYITDISTPLNRARTMAPMMAAFSAGTALGPAIGGVLANTIGISHTFWAVGGMFGVLGVGTYAAMAETHRPVRLAQQQRAAGHVVDVAASSPAAGAAADRRTLGAEFLDTFRQWGPLLQNRKLRGMLSLNVCYWIALAGSQMTLLPMILSGPEYGLDAQGLGTVFAMMSVIAVLGAQPCAALADRFGKPQAIVPACFILGGSMLALPFMHSYESMMALMAVWAVGGTMLGSAPTAHVTDIVPPEARTQALALMRTVGDVGLLVGAGGAGLLADWSSMGAAMDGNAGLLLVATTWFAFRTLWSRTSTASSAEEKKK